MCIFTAADIFTLMSVLIRGAFQRGKTPVVIFDVDSCLFHNGPRTFEILRRFVESVNHAFFDARVAELNLWTLPYGPLDISRLIWGDSDAPFEDNHWEEFWKEHFISGTYLHHDVPFSGAAGFVHRILATGAKVVYLTGRHSPEMLEGTLQNLRDHGFPLPDGEMVHLMLKPDRETPDLVFKTEAYEQIAGLGEVVGGFDNEPGNANATGQRFPWAMSVHVQTCWSQNAPALHPTIFVMKDFAA